MEIKIKFKRLTYAGKSVGRDIRVEIEILGASLRVDKRLKRGSTVEIDKDIGGFQINQAALVTSVQIKVTEKDLLFSDVGQINQSLVIDTSKLFPQKFEYQVPVRERRKFFWKRTAIFTVVIEVQLASGSGDIDQSPTVDNPKWTGDFRDDSSESGANHYYDHSISTPPWAKQETFKIKIGPFYFHEL